MVPEPVKSVLTDKPSTSLAESELPLSHYGPARRLSLDAETKYQKTRVLHWNEVARKQERWTGWSGYYHRRLTQLYQSLVSPGQSVLELGCARGDLLAALRPATGIGVDFSEEMIHAASRRHPDLRFVHADVHELNLAERFDVIILSDLVNDLWDVQTVLKGVSELATPRSR